jgi:hypothetical protein
VTAYDDAAISRERSDRTLRFMRRCEAEPNRLERERLLRGRATLVPMIEPKLPIEGWSERWNTAEDIADALLYAGWRLPKGAEPPTDAATTCQLCSAMVAAEEDQRHLQWHFDQTPQMRRLIRREMSTPCQHPMATPSRPFCPDCASWLDAVDD